MNLQNARRALKQEDNRDFNFKPELMCENKMKLSNKKEMTHPKEEKKKDKAKNALQGCHVKDKA